jgi:hypothetical protein
VLDQAAHAARVASPRATCTGIGRPRGLARRNCGERPRRCSSATFALLRQATSPQTKLPVFSGSSTASNRANSRASAPAGVSCSRYSQIVLASGTASCSALPETQEAQPVAQLVLRLLVRRPKVGPSVDSP